MATMRVTITKPNVTNAYGIVMTVGQIYTVDFDFGRSLVQAGKATDTDAVMTAPAVGSASINDVIVLTAAEIASPTVAVLSNKLATYMLNVAPFTRYTSDGTQLISAEDVDAQGMGVSYNGDSFEARTWNESVAFDGTPSQSNGIATWPKNNHAILPNQSMYISGYTDDRWNGRFTVLNEGYAANSFKTAIDPSAPQSPTAGLHAVVMDPPQRTPSGPYSWVEYKTGLDFGFRGVMMARGGRLLSQMDAEWERDAAYVTGRVVMIQGGGTNDPKGGVAPTSSIASIRSMCAKNRRRGWETILCTVPPLAGAANTSDTIQKTLELNSYIWQLGLELGLPVWDLYSIAVDPATSAIKAIYVDTDNIHVNPRFWQAAEPTLTLILQRKGLAGMPIQLPATIADTIGVNSGSSNVMDGFFAGTGGAVAGTAVDNGIATGWTLTGVTAAFEGSKGTGAAGASQIVTVPNASAGNYSLVGASVHASLAAGQRVRFIGLVESTMVAPFRATFGVNATINGVSSVTMRMASTFSATQAFPAGTYAMVLQSEPWDIPSGLTITNFAPALTVVLTGAAETGTLEFSQFAMRIR